MPSLNDNQIGIQIVTTTDSDGISQARKDIKGIGEQTKETDKVVSKSSDNFQDSMKKLTVATGVAGAAVTLYAKNSVDYLGDAVRSAKTLATQTGMTIEESSRLNAVVSRLGIDASSAAGSFRIFSKAINESRDGTEENALKQEELRNKIEATKIKLAEMNKELSTNGDSNGALKNNIEALNIQLKGYEQNLSTGSGALGKLGVATKDADGKNRSFYDILLAVADKFKEMPDGPEKTATALELFGRSGAGMIKVLNQGGEGITKLGEEADKLGLTLNESNVGAFSEYIKSQKAMADSTNALKIAVGTETAPVMAAFNTQLNEFLLTVIGTQSPVHDLVVGFLAFGGPVLGAVSAVATFAGSISDAIPLVKSLGAVVSSPIVMPAIVVAAAIAALATVLAKINEVNDAIAGTKASVKSLEDDGNKVKADAQARYNSGQINKAQYEKLTGLGNKMVSDAREQSKQDPYAGAGFFAPLLRSGANAVNYVTGRNATGTNNWRGGPTWVGENGPEIIDAPMGSKIYNTQDSQRMSSGGGQTFHIQQVVLSSGEAVRTFFDQNDRDAQNLIMGLSPSRGMTI